MPLNRSCSVDAFRENVAAEIAAGKSRDQAVAIAHSTLRDACGERTLPLPASMELSAVARSFRRKGGPTREYLEEALTQAKAKLSHRDYATLHHAARSRAGGRIAARGRATTLEKALAFGVGSLLEHELTDALDRVSDMVAEDVRLGRASSVAKMLAPELEAEALRRAEKSDPGGGDVHVPSALGGGGKSKKRRRPAEEAIATEVEIAKADRSSDPGVMIALRLPANTANAIALGGANAEPPERLHVTLVYLGRMSTLGESGLEAAAAAIRDVIAGAPILRGALAGVGRFAGTESSDGKDVVIGLVDVPGLTDLRARLVSALLCRGLAVASKHDYTPHVTLAYVDEGAPTPRLDDRLRLRDVYFDKIVLAVNDADTSFALGEMPPMPTMPSPEAFSMSVAKGERLSIPTLDIEVTDVTADGAAVFAAGAMTLMVEKADGFEPGDLVRVRPEGWAPGAQATLEPSPAVEPMPVESAYEVFEKTRELLDTAMPLPFEGPADARVVFVVAAPTDLEAARRQPMVGPDGVAFAERYLGPLMLTKSQVGIGFAVPVLPEPPEAGPGIEPPDLVVPPEQIARWAFWLDKSLERWPNAKIVAIGKAARLALGDRAHVALPHPSVVRRYDSGEVARKMRTLARSLDADRAIRDTPIYNATTLSSTETGGRVAEAIGELKAAGQIQVRISKAADEKRIVYGVVLDPYQVDAHGDWIPPAEIESTAHGFLKKSRVIGVEHRKQARAQIVESFVVAYPTVKDYRLALENRPHKVYEMPYGDDKVHSGAWIAGVELGPEEWEAHKRGELNAFSIGGFSFKTKVPQAAMPAVEFVTLAPVF